MTLFRERFVSKEKMQNNMERTQSHGLMVWFRFDFPDFKAG